MTQLTKTQIGQGPDIVLLHGWGLNSGVWRGVLNSLSQQFCVHLIDLPGFGLNHQVFPNAYDFESVVDMVEAVIPADASIMGWSLGGLIAQKIAIRQQLPLRQLILVGSTPRFLEDDNWPGIKAKVLTLFHGQLAQDFKQTLARFLAIQGMGSPTLKADIKQLQQDIQDFPAPSMEALVGGLKLLESVDLREQQPHIQVPTTRIYGRLDSLVPHKMHNLIRDSHPKSRVEVLDKASHAPFISHPEDFIQLIINLKN